MIDEHRLKILTDGAKYDVSCSSSGSKRKNKADGLGNAAFAGICHSFAADGRYFPTQNFNEQRLRVRL